MSTPCCNLINIIDFIVVLSKWYSAKLIMIKIISYDKNILINISQLCLQN